MKNRKSLINAILSGKIEEVKRIKMEANEPNFIVLSFRNGKYVSLKGSKTGENQEYTPEEVERLNKNYDLILLTRAPGEITGHISESEEEIDL